MKIKRRGWIGRTKPLRAAITEIDHDNHSFIREGAIVIDLPKRGKPTNWEVNKGVDEWPPREVEVTIEVREVDRKEFITKCFECGENFKSGDCIVVNAYGDYSHIECEKPGKIEKLGPAKEYVGWYEKAMKEKINEIIERVNDQ